MTDSTEVERAYLGSSRMKNHMLGPYVM